MQSDRLKSVIERVEKLEEDRRQIQDGIKDVLDEAKGEGFDVKTLKKVIKLRKMRPDKIEEEDALLDTYRQALGV